MLFRIKLAVIVGGLFLGWYGLQETRLGSSTKSEPTLVSASQLITDGYGDNAYVTVNNFWCTDSMVYEAKEGNETNGPYTKVWIPAVPLEGEYAREYLSKMNEVTGQLTGPPPTLKRVDLVFKFTNITGDELSDLAGADQVTGVVINQIESLGQEEMDHLRRGYGNVALDSPLVVQIGREPTSMVAGLGMMLGGVVLSLGGVGSFFIGRGEAAAA